MNLELTTTLTVRDLMFLPRTGGCPCSMSPDTTLGGLQGNWGSHRLRS